MLFTNDQIIALAREYYGLEGTVNPLPGEIDLNYRLTTPEGASYVLKIAHTGESAAHLVFQHDLIAHLAKAGTGLQVPEVVPTVHGNSFTEITTPGGDDRFLRLLTWIEGRCLADIRPHTTALLEQVGAMCGHLSRALAGFDHPVAHRSLKWDPSGASWTRLHLSKLSEPDQQDLALYFWELFEREAVPLFPVLRKSINYNDANDYNILVTGEEASQRVPGVIDFGDAVFTHTVNELAIAAAYAAMHKPDPLAAIAHLVRGYHREYPLEEYEAQALFALIGARLLISVTCSAMNRAEHPGNAYLQISDAPAWELMKKLRAIPPSLALATIRHACGWEPCSRHTSFQAWLGAKPPVYPIVADDLREATWLDLSVGSADLGNYADIEAADALHRRILAAQMGKPGIGRYDEVRPFYTTDAYEVRGNNGPQWRTVHVGLDIFLPPGTPVMAPLDGRIHSFKDNDKDRDYGPAIILEHRVSDTLAFYTLYGHLARVSLTNKEKGQIIRAGEVFGEIGPMPENGNWSPHLHFQVILDMLGMEGDYPGVAFSDMREVWKSLCPDPWLLLTGEPSPRWSTPDSGEILVARSRFLGSNLSLSYRSPLAILRGWRQYLFDETGRRYLDTVNNVAHVGHEHPRIVQSGQRQMAVLNTNTRYLHAHIVRFAEAILETLPSPLEVVYLVNSGSEANELAMRMARTCTGSRGILAVEAGYHGNTQACIEVSSYKFDGPGGKGAPEHVRVVPLPDTYRGMYKGFTKENGLLYAESIPPAVRSLEEAGHGIAAFLCETVISCGGQIPLPPGYLASAAQQIRMAGGLLISDEVQTGCGRHGRYFWAFEEHGVVPDIVTFGKPIGNGHPLGGVITTREVADAFANGMEYFNTFGGNPVSCAIGLEVLHVIREEGLQQNALEIGDYLSRGLSALSDQYPVIGDVRGPGLFIGFELINDPETLDPAAEKAAYLANRMRELGILMSTDGPLHNVIKIKPPLVFTRTNADFLLEMLENVLKENRMQWACIQK